MPRKLRFHPDPTLPVEITVRCTQGRFLLRPSPKLNRRIAGILAYAAMKYGVKIHAPHVMSNHYGLLLTVPDAATMASFMRLVNQQISVEVGHLHGWTGAMWEGRYHAITIEDEASQISRLRYSLSNCVKENLVARVRDWPGLQAAAALIDGTRLEGEWVDRTAMDAAQRRNPSEPVREEDFTVPMDLELHPLPCLAQRPHGQRNALYRRLVKEVEQDAAGERARTGAAVLGAERVLAMDPHHRPVEVARSPAPLIHAITKAAHKLWRTAYRAFADAYRRAADAHRDDCAFPEGCIPPLHRACAPPAAA